MWQRKIVSRAPLEQSPHFVFSNFALIGYNWDVLTKPKTERIMMMDLRDGPIRCGMPEERSGTIRDCRPSRKGGVAG